MWVLVVVPIIWGLVAWGAIVLSPALWWVLGIWVAFGVVGIVVTAIQFASDAATERDRGSSATAKWYDYNDGGGGPGGGGADL